MGLTTWSRGIGVFAALVAVSCASADKKAVLPRPLAATASVPAVDRVGATLAEADAVLRAGLAAADEGHLDRARTDFDRSLDLYLAWPGGALSEPRLAESYRRALETIQAREAEMIAAGDGYRESASEPASIDAVAGLPVGAAPASEATREQAQAAVAEELLDLPIELNEPVLSCLDLYQGRLREWFGAALNRGHRYLPHIRRVFAEEGIPQDLAYVALVESAFKPTAYSRARARGVWQFISATGRRYGLQQDWWVDERSDPEKATHAAARYLKTLHGMFGDWNLALAGYNAGEMKVVRAIRRHGTADFWALRRTSAFRAETKNYVPLIHAAIVIAKAPERYGFTVVPEAPPEFEQVEINGAYDLRVVAECAGEPVETLKNLNPELRRLATPANRTFALRVPAATGPKVAECVANLPPEKRVNFRTHVVRRGQTLSGIARANGVRTRDIAEANGLPAGRRLRPGTELIIPVPARARVATSRRERAAAAEPVRTAENQARRIRYRIRPGDTLTSIAARHHTTVDDLRAWNRLQDTRIAAGELLTIYTN